MHNISLRSIMTQGYFYVEEHESMGKALGVMRDRHISFLFVMHHDLPVGIITERKVMETAITGRNLLALSAKEVMSSPLLSMHPEDNAVDASGFMQRNQIRHIAVVSGDGRLKGSVTPGNIVNRLGSDIFSSSALVRDIMYTDIVLEKPEANLKEAGRAILQKKTCCAIIMDGHVPIGLTSEKDAVSALSYGQKIEAIKLNKIMSSPVVIVKEMDTVTQGVLTLRANHIHRAVVTDSENRVVGTFALNNLVDHMDIVMDKKLMSYSQ